MWQPTDRNLHNVEADEAGRLAAFRERFGRQFDMGRTVVEEAVDMRTAGDGGVKKAEEEVVEEKVEVVEEVEEEEDLFEEMIAAAARGQPTLGKKKRISKGKKKGRK